MPLAGKLTDRFGGGPLALFGVIADRRWRRSRSG